MSLLVAVLFFFVFLQMQIFALVYCQRGIPKLDGAFPAFERYGI